VLGILIGVAVVVLRGRSVGKEFSEPSWNDPAVASMDMTAQFNQPTTQPVVQPVQPSVQQPMQPSAQPAHPVMQQPAEPAMQAPLAVAPAPPVMATAPPPPAQPMTVASYTGLPPGGSYDQSTGQTVYVQPDGTRWQMMGDGSFTRLN
jgi:hypothetical protein